MKIRQIITFMIILFGLVLPIKSKAISTSTLTYYYDDTLWFTLSGGGKTSMTFQYATYEVDGKVAYCIQPGMPITTNTYIESTGDIYDKEQLSMLELIGYYGYDYPSHQTFRYRMATQALIWEYLSGQNATFWSTIYGDVNVDYEKNEIRKLINNHNNLPEFDNMFIEINIDKEIVVSNIEKLLKDYDIVASDDFEIDLENGIRIKPLKIGRLKLLFKRKSYDNMTTIVYSGYDRDSQKLGFFRISNQPIVTINIDVYGKIEIEKVGEDDNKLEGVEFGLYAEEDIYDFDGNKVYEKDALIESKVTDEDGNIIFDMLYSGKYKIRELKTLEDYVLDDKEYNIEINNDNKIVSLTLKNYLKKITIEVPNTLAHDYIKLSSLISILFGIKLIKYGKK